MSEFEDRPYLNRKRVIVLFVDGMFKFLVVVFFVVSMVLLLQNAKNGADARNRLLDCTTPEGTCFNEGQQRTAEAVKGIDSDGQDREKITRFTIIATQSCGKVYVSLKDIQACVNVELEKAGLK